MDKPKRPPNDRDQGRKPLKAGEETVSFTFRLPISLREKLERIGGSSWLRDKIQAAKDKKPQEP